MFCRRQLCHQFCIVVRCSEDISLLAAFGAPVHYYKACLIIQCAYRFHHPTTLILPVSRVDVYVHRPQTPGAMVRISIAHDEHSAVHAFEVLLLSRESFCHQTNMLNMSAGIGIFRRSFEPKRPEGHQISSFAKFSGAIPDSAIPARKFI